MNGFLTALALVGAVLFVCVVLIAIGLETAPQGEETPDGFVEVKKG